MPGAFAGRGIATLALGYAVEALPDLDHALALDPSLREARYYRSVAYARLERYQEAISDLDAVVAAGGNLGYVYSDRGGILFKLGRPDDALRDLQTAAELDPDLSPAHVNLAAVLATLGRYAEAVPHFEAAAAAGVPNMAAKAQRARDHAYVAAVEDGSAGQAAEAFVDAASVDDIRRAVARWPFMAYPAFIDSLVAALPEVAAASPTQAAAMRSNIELFRRLVASGE